MGVLHLLKDGHQFCLHAFAVIGVDHQYTPNYTTQLQRQYFSIYHRGVNAMGYAEGSSQHYFMIGLHVINVIYEIIIFVITYNDTTCLDEYS